MVKGKRVVLVLLLALLSLLVALPSQASAETLAQKKARARAILQQLTVLDTKMEIVVERYDAANQKLQSVRQQIAENRHNLMVARYNLTVAKANLEARVVSMYKQRPVDLLDVVLATTSFDDLITQLDLLNRVGESDSTVVSSIDHYKMTIVDTSVALSADEKVAEQLLSERTAEKQKVEQQLAVRQSMYRGVKAQIQQLEAQQQAQADRVAQQAGVLTVGGTPPPGITGAAAYAFQFLGCPYLYGAAGPDKFDCSGFTMFVYAHFGVALPHNAAAQQGMCTPVTVDQLQAGDLVFFGNPAYHVGLCIGGGEMIHAPHTGSVVSVSSIAGASGYGRP